MAKHKSLWQGGAHNQDGLDGCGRRRCAQEGAGASCDVDVFPAEIQGRRAGVDDIAGGGGFFDGLRQRELAADRRQHRPGCLQFTNGLRQLWESCVEHQLSSSSIVPDLRIVDAAAPSGAESFGRCAMPAGRIRNLVEQEVRLWREPRTSRMPCCT